MRELHSIFLVALAMLLVSCTAGEDEFGRPGDGYPADTAKIVAGVDWSAAEELTVELSEFKFTPKALTLRTGRPYALTLVNTGYLPHTFTAGEFFRAVAAKSILYTDGEAGFPQLESVSLAAKESKTLFFVPVTPGSYGLSCTQTLHGNIGMAGQIQIR